MSEDAAALRQRIESLTIAISVRSVPRILGSLLQSKLTIPQLKVLTTVVVNASSTASELVSEFGVSMATVSKLVDRLVDQRLVERVVGEGDQRVRTLRPTALGRQVVQEIMGARPELGADVLAGLSVAELAALETGLRAVSRELQATSGARETEHGSDPID